MILKPRMNIISCGYGEAQGQNLKQKAADELVGACVMLMCPGAVMCHENYEAWNQVMHLVEKVIL